MRYRVLKVLALLASWTACETIYEPELEITEPLLVAEARFVYGQPENTLRLSRTVSFSKNAQNYPAVTDANVYLIDDSKNTYMLQNSGSGNYRYSRQLDAGRKYKIAIHTGGEIFESSFQEVPDIPGIDTVYAEPCEKLVENVTDQAAGTLLKEPGIMLYADIGNSNHPLYCRFSGNKICQFTYPFLLKPFMLPETMFCWISVSPGGVLNLAAPPEYAGSAGISKHPLVFLEKEYPINVGDTVTSFEGWIYICYQYAISADTYRFYQDMNAQLSASGKLFDPLYTQVKGNITCKTDSAKTVLGNFEIASLKEHRFFVEMYSREKYFLKKIPYLYPIPHAGKSPVYPPEWWERPRKDYPVKN